MSHIAIPLRARDGSLKAHALVDAADADQATHRWYLSNRGRPGRNVPLPGGGQRQVLLHRELLGLSPSDGLEGDHINGDKLDNRRGNLRVVLRADNVQNVVGRGGTSEYRGVSWHKQHSKWQARAAVAGRTHFIGLFECEREAALAAQAFRLAHMPFTNEDRSPV